MFCNQIYFIKNANYLFVFLNTFSHFIGHVLKMSLKYDNYFYFIIYFFNEMNRLIMDHISRNPIKISIFCYKSKEINSMSLNN